MGFGLAWLYLEIGSEHKGWLMNHYFVYAYCHPFLSLSPFQLFRAQNWQTLLCSALRATSATTSARSKTCDVLCIPARYLVTLALLSGGVCSPLLHFLAKARLEKTCSFLLNGAWCKLFNSPDFFTGIGSPCPTPAVLFFPSVLKLEKW